MDFGRYSHYLIIILTNYLKDPSGTSKRLTPGIHKDYRPEIWPVIASMGPNDNLSR